MVGIDSKLPIDHSKPTTKTSGALPIVAILTVALLAAIIMLGLCVLMCELPIAFQSRRESIRLNEAQQNMDQLKKALDNYDARQERSPSK